MDVRARNNVVVLDGPPEDTVVLAHGFGTDQRMWRLVAPALAGRHRVVLFDYVGAGRSDSAAYAPERYATLDGYVGDVLEILAAVDAWGVVFVGHSVSGMIGVRAAVAAPDRFAGLVLLNASARYLDDPPDYKGGFSRADIDGLLDMMACNYSGWAAALAPQVMANPDRPELAEELERSFSAVDPSIARAFAAVTYLSDTRAALAHVRVPVLLLQSKHDIVVPREATEHLLRNIPDSTLRVLGCEGHFPHLSSAEGTVHEITSWMWRTLGRGGPS